MSRLVEWARQRTFPAEFRIAPPARLAADAAVAPSPVDFSDEVVADIATETWRARRKLGDGYDQRQPRAQRQASRHLRSLWERLSDTGVVVQEHEGTRYDVGLELEVLAYQDDPTVTEEVVTETVRPSVYRDGRCIQVGEVVVAQPEKGRGDDTRDS